MMIVHPAYFADSNQKFSLSKQEAEIGEVCIANISPLERKKRLNFAIQQFVITLLILGVMIALQMNPLWRLLLQFMFAAATVSYFQARDKT